MDGHLKDDDVVQADEHDMVIECAQRQGSLRTVHDIFFGTDTASSSTGYHEDNTSYFWHHRLGHLGRGGLETIATKNNGVVVEIRP